MKRVQKIYLFLIVFCICVFNLILGIVEGARFFSPERPVVTYYNRKYVSYVNASAHRRGRNNPVYYGSLHFQTLHEVGNNVSVNLYFHEYNGIHQYRSSYISIHYKLCDLVEKDQFIGQALRQGKFLRPCPYPADDYHFVNMTVRLDAMPSFIPLVKGRAVANVTATKTGEVIASAFSDIEIREI